MSSMLQARWCIHGIRGGQRQQLTTAKRNNSQCTSSCLSISMMTSGCVAAFSCFRKCTSLNTMSASFLRSISPTRSHQPSAVHGCTCFCSMMRNSWCNCKLGRPCMHTISLQYLLAKRVHHATVTPAALRAPFHGRHAQKHMGLVILSAAPAYGTGRHCRCTFCTICFAMMSASTTGRPCAANSADTVLFPVAIPPVKPMTRMVICVCDQRTAARQSVSH